METLDDSARKREEALQTNEPSNSSFEEENEDDATRGVYRLYHFSKIPDWMKDNPSILEGYRMNLGLRRTILSLFRIHNETGNIWTHLLGAVFFLVLMLAISYEQGFLNFSTRYGGYTCVGLNKDRRIISIPMSKKDLTFDCR